MGAPGKKRMIGKNETKNVMAENEPTALETRRTVDARCGDQDPEHRENNGPDNTGRRAFRVFRDHASPHPRGYRSRSSSFSPLRCRLGYRGRPAAGLQRHRTHSQRIWAPPRSSNILLNALQTRPVHQRPGHIARAPVKPVQRRVNKQGDAPVVGVTQYRVPLIILINSARDIGNGRHDGIINCTRFHIHTES